MAVRLVHRQALGQLHPQDAVGLVQALPLRQGLGVNPGLPAALLGQRKPEPGHGVGGLPLVAPGSGAIPLPPQWGQTLLHFLQGITPNRLMPSGPLIIPVTRYSPHPGQVGWVWEGWFMVPPNVAPLRLASVNPFDQLIGELYGPLVKPTIRRWPQYSITRDQATGRCEVVSVEPGGSQRATWTMWAPAAPPEKDRDATPTVFEHPGRDEPTEEFKALVEDLRKRGDPSPFLKVERRALGE